MCDTFPLSSPQEQRDILHGLRQLAFECESESSLSNERRRSLCAKEFKKLGFSVSALLPPLLSPTVLFSVSRPVSFQNNSNPGQDLVRTPPGLLALDTMYYFARRYPDAYSRVSWDVSAASSAHSKRTLRAGTHRDSISFPSLCWKTAAGKTNTNVLLPGAASSSRSSSVRSFVSERPVSGAVYPSAAPLTGLDVTPPPR